MACVTLPGTARERWLTSTKGAKLVKFVEVTPKAVVRTLPRTLPVLKLAMCKLMSIPNTVASTPCELQQCILVKVLSQEEQSTISCLPTEHLTARHRHFLTMLSTPPDHNRYSETPALASGCFQRW